MSDLVLPDPGSPAFFDCLVADPGLFATLSEGERRAFGIALRDRFLALPPGRGGEEARIRAVVDAVEPQPVLALEGLSVSYFPSGRLRSVRFLDARHVDEALWPLFARPSEQMPHLLAVFVDPEELSFRTFENILPLDRLFEGSGLDLSLSGRTVLGEERGAPVLSFAVHAPEATRDLLARLDGLGLYAPPLNPGSRGGVRFVFHSALLARVLTRAVREALPAELLDGFSHVNPVFRCNRFDPGDAGFCSHVDTPYYDAARRHVSRYTLLLYLTGGRGAPALRVGDGVVLDEIAPMTAVLFEQRHEHEGGPYLDGRKLFLRTELVFEGADLLQEPKIAQLFARACYLTGESTRAPELDRFAHDAYDRAAAAHWRGIVDRELGARETPFFHKEFEGVHFVTNGYDAWFPKGACSLEACAALTLLDVLNCRIGGEAFRKRCTSEVLVRDGEDTAWIPSFLASVQRPASGAPLGKLDPDALLPPPEEPDEHMCCPFHAMRFDPSLCGDIIEQYGRAQEYTRKKLLSAPILAMGQEIFLDPDRFLVRDNQILLLAKEALRPVNFASCWNFGGSEDDYLGVETSVEALELLVPPILFSETAETWHLMFDLFRNGWMVDQRVQSVPVPKILLRDPGEVEEEGGSPWAEALGAEPGEDWDEDEDDEDEDEDEDDED